MNPMLEMKAGVAKSLNNMKNTFNTLGFSEALVIFDIFLVVKKVTFWSPLESLGFFRGAKMCFGAKKNMNFQPSFLVFSAIRAGTRSRVDF